MTETAVSDSDLERQIDFAYRRMCNAVQRSDKDSAWLEMAALVKTRSPEQILKMERERRLRH